MLKDMLSGITDINAKELVLSFIAALNQEDFDVARSYAADDMTFTGVLGSRNNATEYFNDMRQMKLRYTILKAFEDENDVCLLYDLTMSGLTIFGCGWYQVQGGKIKSLRVVFDPRPVLTQGKN